MTHELVSKLLQRIVKRIDTYIYVPHICVPDLEKNTTVA